MDREAYVEAVLSLVEAIPPGRVMSYGAIAACVGVGGPRQVGAVMAEYGGGVPWWRVVRADGTPPLCHDGRAWARHLEEGTPTRGDRILMRSAAWYPPGGPEGLPGDL